MLFFTRMFAIPYFCTEKQEESTLNKFAAWMENNDKKYRGVAEKLEISTATMHNVLRKGHMPSLNLAYRIEQYTKGAITLYDWVDEPLPIK